MHTARPVSLGSVQANRGRGLEDLLTLQHARYERDGRAWLRHPPATVTVQRREGAIVGARYTEAAQADYAGFVCGGRHGRAVAAEAKETRAGLLPWGRLPPQQQEHLDACLAAGGVAALIVWWLPDQTLRAGNPRRTRSEVWCVPWAECVRLRLADIPGLRWTPAPQGDTWRVEAGRRGLCDWLAVIERAEALRGEVEVNGEH